ncbi:hypothetical protein [Kouleothrix sp.]|uniref:hypothetical protein n=1 Tax=Kouleothrix sp. TaxID=2779161 RepID=UPI00391B73C4
MAAGATDEASLRRALDADGSFAKSSRHSWQRITSSARNRLNKLLQAFIAVGNQDALAGFWQSLPPELERQLYRIVEAPESARPSNRATAIWPKDCASASMD